MAGYVRTDTSDNIVDLGIINAADLDGEFDALAAAFDSSSGHTHDGTLAQGAPITVVGPAQDFVADAVSFKTKTTSTYTLGTPSVRWSTGYLDNLVLTTALPVSQGGTGSTTAAGVRSAFGVVIGTNVQAYSSLLTELNQSLVSGAAPTFGIANMTLDDTNLVVADSTNLQTFAEGVDDALLKARGTGVTSTYVSTITVGGSTFSQPAVSGEISSDEGYFSVSYAGATGVTIANLSAASTYVYIDKAGALQQQTTIPTRQDWSRKMFTMRIAVDLSTNLIIGFEYLNNPIGHYANSIRDLYAYLLAQGVPFKKDQTVTGRAGDLGFDVSAGSLMEFGGTGDINNANIKSFNAVANASYTLLSRTAIVSVQTDLVKFWDNAGTITALGSTTVVGHRLFRYADGALAMQYGQGNYANMSLAKAGVVLEDYVLNPLLKDATFFGWWLIESTATNTGGTTLTDFAEYTIGIQGGSSGSLAGCLLKGNNLSDLLDVPVARSNLGLGTAATTAATDYVQVTSATGQANLPAGTTAQRTATPGTGALRFNSTDVSFEGYNGTEWGSIGGGAADGIFYENEQNVTADYTIVATKNAMTAGPITIASGVSVTIETGGRWIVL